MRRESKSIGDCIDRFSSLWEKLSGALQPQVPPEMMKKDQFMIGLRADLRLRVELKKPRSYEEVVDVAKRKEWKLTMMSNMGMTDSLQLAMETRRPKPIVQRVPVEVLQPVVQPIVSPVVPPTVVVATDDGLRQDMKQVVDLMRNLNLNLLNGVGNGR